MTEEELAWRLIELLNGHDAVRSVRLVGSRAEGHATELSDVDLLVDADLDVLERDLAVLVAPLEPLAAQWDRLSEEASYFMLLLPGGIKVDLVFDVPPTNEPPWQVGVGTLPAIDAHFWDWILWLGGKQLGGRDELVESMLGGLMFEHLLGPLGVAEPPATIDETVRAYLAARDAREAGLGVTVGRELQEAVLPRLRAAGLVDER